MFIFYFRIVEELVRHSDHEILLIFLFLFNVLIEIGYKRPFLIIAPRKTTKGVGLFIPLLYLYP